MTIKAQRVDDVLVTGTMFVGPEHEQKLNNAGFAVHRLDEPDATPAQLTEALAGKVGYILGGVEKVPGEVLRSADKLRAIAFPGSDWAKLFPDPEALTECNIMLTNGPGNNAIGVAEWAIGVATQLIRQLPQTGRLGDADYLTTRSIQQSQIGILGGGHIAQAITRAALAFQPTGVRYWSRSERTEMAALGASFTSLDEVLSASDVIFVAIPGTAGETIGASNVDTIKDGATLVSVSPVNVVDVEALLPRLRAGTLRAAHDWSSPTADFDDLPHDVWFASNAHAAFNTHAVMDVCSTAAVDALINMLTTGDDPTRVA